MKRTLRISGGKKLKSPIGENTRPTSSKVREALINILRYKLINSSWLDLFSGSGIMACEALQNGATKVLSIEKDKKISLICKENLISTKTSITKEVQIGIIQNDVFKVLKKGAKNITAKEFDKDFKFDFIYLDPPYKEVDFYSEVLNGLITGNWLSKESIVICEHATKTEIVFHPPWVQIDKRTYGSTSLLLINHQG